MSEVKTYQQAAEPSDLNPGTKWLRDDGTWAIRKPDLTWNEMGAWTEENGGMLPVSGGTMAAPIQGNHGLAPLASPPFTGAPTVNSDEIADKPWVMEEIASLQTELQNYIGGVMGDFSTGAASSALRAYGSSGINGAVPVAHGDTIPLPTYADGSTASLSEVKAVIVSLSEIISHSSDSRDLHPVWAISVDSNLVVTCTLRDEDEYHEGTVNFLIICER